MSIDCCSLPALPGPMQRSHGVIPSFSSHSTAPYSSNRRHDARVFCSLFHGLSRLAKAEALEVVLAHELLLPDESMMPNALILRSALVLLSLSLLQMHRSHVELQEVSACRRLQSNERLTYGFPISVVDHRVVSTCCSHRLRRRVEAAMVVGVACHSVRSDVELKCV